MTRLVSSLLCVLLLCLVPASALSSDLFAWWQRDLLELSLVPGDWVEMASLEEGAEGAHADTLVCRVLAAEGPNRWVGIWPASGEDWWLLHVDADELAGSRSLEASLVSLHRMLPDGSGVAEDLERLRESQLFRRRLEDPFGEPEISERPLEDAEFGGRTLRRREVELSEERQRRIPLGRKQEMLYSIRLRSLAQLSPDIPIFGLLRSDMTSEERTERVDGAGERIGPPPELSTTRRTLECLGFGREEPRGIPEFRR